MAKSGVGVLTDEEKQVLLDRNLDIVWIDDVTEVECVRCHRVPIQQYVSNCRHNFCKNCKRVLTFGEGWRCPKCKEYVTNMSDQGFELEDTIYQLQAHCPNKKYGCHYQGQLKTIPGHLRGCKDTRDAALPAEFNGITLDTAHVAELSTHQQEQEQKKELADLEKILKDVKQLQNKESRDALEIQQLKSQLQQQHTLIDEQKQHLNEELQSANVEQTIKEIEERDALEMQQLKSQLQQPRTYIVAKVMLLALFLIAILLLFGQMMKQLNSGEELGKIVKQLQNKEASDELEIQQLRSQQQQRTRIDTHSTQFDQMMEQSNTVEEQVNSLEDDVDEIEETLLNVTQINPHVAVLNKWLMKFPVNPQMYHDALQPMTLVYDWDTMDNAIEPYERGINPRESEVFPLTRYYYGAKASTDAKGFIHLQLIDYKETNRPVDTKSMPRMTYVFVSQIQTTQGKQQRDATQRSTDGIRTTFIKFDQSSDCGEYVYIQLPSSISKFPGPPHVVSKGVKLRVYVEPQSIACISVSNNGILLWQLDNYEEKKQMEVDGLIYDQLSHYYYTSPHGYRVLIKLELSEETVVGELWFMTGEFNSSLTEEFIQRSYMTTINHTEQPKNLVIGQEGLKLMTSINTNIDFTKELEHWYTNYLYIGIIPVYLFIWFGLVWFICYVTLTINR